MKSIIVLEEDAESREILSKMLRGRGFRVLPVEHETAARTALDSTHPADLVLAGATYRERLFFLADLRKHRHSVPVIFLADCGNARPRLSGLFSGFSLSRRLNCYMNTRPVDFFELDRLIRIVLNSRGGRTANTCAA